MKNCMALPLKEYIQSINFFHRGIDGEDVKIDSHSDLEMYKCVIETYSNIYILNIDPNVVCDSNDVDIFFLADDFYADNPSDFLDSQLLNIVDNVNELKKDAKFLTHTNQNKAHGKWDSKYFKFETSKGNFYVVAAIFWLKYPHVDSWKFQLKCISK